MQNESRETDDFESGGRIGGKALPQRLPTLSAIIKTAFSHAHVSPAASDTGGIFRRKVAPMPAVNMTTIHVLQSHGDDEWHALQLKGLSLAIVLATSIFAALTTIVMTLRVFVRVKTKKWGLDDWIMLAGFIINLGQSAIAIYGSYTGIGTRDADMNLATSVEGYKSLLIWQALYAGSLAFIKSSICVTLIRIATEKIYKTILWSLVGLSASLSTIGLIVIVNQCHPLDRYWDKTVPGTCWPPIIVTVLSYAASVANVITDFSVAIIPFFMLRNVQMRPRLKLYVRLILGVGVLAGIASIIRVPFTNAYISASDILYHSGNIVLWTIFECGLGIIAGSLPTLRAFFKRLVGDKSSQEYSGSKDTNLVTIGRLGGRHNSKGGVQVTIAADHDNDNDDGNQDEDNNSTSRIVRVDREVRQTVSQGT